VKNRVIISVGAVIAGLFISFAIPPIHAAWADHHHEPAPHDTAHEKNPAPHVNHLIVHLSSDVSARLQKALGFALNQRGAGTKVTLYLDDRGVRVADKSLSGLFVEEQKLLEELAAGDSDVIICPFGMNAYDVDKNDLLEGLTIGGKDFIPKFNEEYLFSPNTRIISW
jgi:predicted peroxiredoxin